jgi:hypothetical protein
MEDEGNGHKKIDRQEAGRKDDRLMELALDRVQSWVAILTALNLLVLLPDR